MLFICNISSQATLRNALPNLTGLGGRRPLQDKYG
jgi:hypothetical protein